MSILLKFWDTFERMIVGTIVVLLFASGVVLNIVEVVRRSVFSTTFSWSIEITVYLLLFSMWLYFGVILIDKGHLRVTLFLGLMPSRIRKIVISLSDVIGLGFCAAMGYWLLKEALKFYELGSTLQDSGLPVGVIYTIASAGMFFMVFRFIEQLCENFSAPAEPAK